MSYLYGDSSPSPLESNFIDFLRMAMDFCVHVVLSDLEPEQETAAE